MVKDDSTRIAFDLRYTTCPCCKADLVSLSRHDFQMCKCPAQSYIDGGQSGPCRVGGADVAAMPLKMGDFVVDIVTDERVLITELMKEYLPLWKKNRLLKQGEVSKERASKVKLDVEQGV